MAAERHGVPIGWVIDGASRNDIRLLRPTLEAVADAGLLYDVETLHLDRGYDYPRRAPPPHRERHPRRQHSASPHLNASPPLTEPDRARWIVESTNSWLSNCGKLRRNTDRRTDCRHAALCLATTILIAAKLIDWENRWNPT